MKKGFTLLELVVVIIILGILATLGLTQYGRMIERSRGAEARAILGDIRKFAAAHYLEYGSLLIGGATNGTQFGNNEAGIGGATDQIPNPCRGSHYFQYNIPLVTAPEITIVASRCNAGTGKLPSSTNPVSLTLNLVSNFANGTDTWDPPTSVNVGGY